MCKTIEVRHTPCTHERYFGVCGYEYVKVHARGHAWCSRCGAKRPIPPHVENIRTGKPVPYVLTEKGQLVMRL